MQIDKVKLKNMLMEFLEKLNNGEKISYDDMELNFSQIKSSIDDILYSIDDFPVDNSNDQIYSFIENEKKFFDKYEIQDISDVILEYMIKPVELKKDYNFYNNIIINYINNDGITRRTIDHIVSNYAHSKNCKDSKNILEILSYKSIPEKILKKEIVKIEETKDKEVLSYATNRNYIKDIADIIMDIEKLENCKKEIKKILKDSKLPKRSDEEYKIISSYEPYELTHCISYEMAIRNIQVKKILEKIRILVTHSKMLYQKDLLYKNVHSTLYIPEIQEEINKLIESLKNLEINLNINPNTSELKVIQNELRKAFTELIVLLEEDYYMIYDWKEIIPEGMEDILKEPNHHETDIELIQYMNKFIKESIKNAYDPSPRYKDNYSVKDGYASYQASYENSKEYDINKIFPNFKRPMKEFNQTQVAFNMSLPKDEIIAYISKIKDDYDNKENSYKTLNQLLYEDDSRIEEKLEHTQQNRYADDFFIYDYYIQSDEEHEKKLESIQKRLSQFHGIKNKITRNIYDKGINYDEMQKDENNKSTVKKTSTININTLVNLSNKEKDLKYYITTNVIKKRYIKMKELIDTQKYKTLIYNIKNKDLN